MGLEMLDMSNMDEFNDSDECFVYPKNTIAWLKECPARCKVLPWADLDDKTVQAVLKEIPEIKQHVTKERYLAKLRESKELFSGRSSSRN